MKLGTRSAGIAAGNMVFTIRDVIHDELELFFQFFSIFLSLFRFFSCDLRSLVCLQCLFLACVWLQFHLRETCTSWCLAWMQIIIDRKKCVEIDCKGFLSKSPGVDVDVSLMKESRLEHAQMITLAAGHLCC